MISGHCHCNAVQWTYLAHIDEATICNCSACRRYGALWAYGYDGEDVRIAAPQDRLSSHIWGSRSLSFDFCNNCGNLVCWRGLHTSESGKRRIAVNLRLAEPEDIAQVPLRRFDGLGSFEDLPLDGRRVGDVWF